MVSESSGNEIRHAFFSALALKQRKQRNRGINEPKKKDPLIASTAISGVSPESILYSINDSLSPRLRASIMPLRADHVDTISHMYAGSPARFAP